MTLYAAALFVFCVALVLLLRAASEVVREELDEADRLEYERTGKVTKRMKRNKRRNK